VRGYGACDDWGWEGTQSESEPMGDLSHDESLVDTVGTDEALPPGVPAPDERVVRGTTIGRYMLLEHIGSGGMGVVFAAYDPDLDRRVALKVLRAHVRRSRGATVGRARLLREAQAIATVHHENVIAVHDVGTVDERVFIAMEFIEGGTLAQWVADERPTLPEVLTVFEQAGRGLAAAHAEGLVHRDFKPDNVLVGHDGRVRVVDFGLARRSATAAGPQSAAITRSTDPSATRPDLAHAADAVPREAAAVDPASVIDKVELAGRDTLRLTDPGGRRHGDPAPSNSAPESFVVEASTGEPLGPAPASSLTRTGAVVGTPAYMAPEQHSGLSATQQSDQFSFCVSLYEAVYGHRPFAGCSHAELVANVTEGSVRAAPRDAKVPQWLRRVLLRGLSPEATDRFASMDVLLAQLQPKQYGRRIGGAAAVVGGVMAAALVGVFAAADDDARTVCNRADEHLRGLWDAPSSALTRDAFVATGKPFAADAWVGTAAALDDYTSRWVHERVDACEATHVRGEQSEDLLDRRMRCLDDRLDGVRVVTALFQDADVAVVTGAVDAVHRLPRPEDCSDPALMAAAAQVPLDQAQRDAVAGDRRALAEARVLIETQRLQPAHARIDRALASATQTGYGPLQAEALLVRADAFEAADDLEGARASLRQGLLAAESCGDDPRTAQAWIDLVWLQGYRSARFEVGRDAADHARAVLKSMGGDASLEALLVSREADLAYAQGDYKASLAQHERALRLRVALDGADHPRTADSRTGIGHALVELERYGDALVHYQAARAILEHTYGAQHPHLAKALTNVGVTQEYLGALGAARETHEQALRVAEQAYGPDHTVVADVLNNYAAVLHRQGAHALATDGFVRAKAIWAEAYGRNHPDVGMALFNLSVVAEDDGDLEAAVGWETEALRVREASQGSEHPDVAQSLHHLGKLLAQPWPEDTAAGADATRRALARRYLRRALAIRAKTLGAAAQETAATQALLESLASPDGL